MTKQAKPSKQTKLSMESNTIKENNITNNENTTVSEETISMNNVVEDSPVVNVDVDINIITSNPEPEKKKRGRKKNVIIQQTSNIITDGSSSTETSAINPEKKIRKRRSKKEKVDGVPKNEDDNVNNDNNNHDDNISSNTTSTVLPIKKRKRRMCKNKTTGENDDSCKNVVINNTDDPNGDSSALANMQTQPEEKVIKKRGRKPKGGKITTHQLEDNSINNEMPNIILHLKCSLSNIKNSTDDEYTIQSYNSTQIHSSEINIKKLIMEHEEDKKNANNITENSTSSINSGNILHNKNSATTFANNSENGITACASSMNNIRPFNEVLNNNISSSLFQVYDPTIPLSKQGEEIINPVVFTSLNDTIPYAKPSTSHTFLNTVYSSDVNSYSNDYDDTDDTPYSSKNEREIWKKINQLKVSFHKSDICNNMGGTQRSACFWCTCDFDSPAIYIPKSLSKDVYNVYGCFCSPECGAAFLMNENIDTSTRFERYHLLNSLYGKIYKYEKSIKIAPNPFYLLNKYYGNLTIQEYRKLFQSDQMIYVVNKPLTHILPELYEDNNDFLLNSKIIPNNTVNIKKNKPLKSNILNNAFGIN